MKLILAATLLIVPLLGVGQATDIRSIALSNVVRIEAPTPSGQTERGYGLIISRDQDVLWVSTAEHIVRWKPAMKDGLDHSPRFTVRMNGRPGSFELADRPRWVTENTDLAFLPIRVPRNGLVENWREVVIAATTTPGESVALLGSAHDSLEVSTGGGRIGLVAGKVVDLDGVAAQSGAPVATANGIIGLHLGSGVNGPKDTVIIPISDVERGARSKDVLWQLSENYSASTYKTRVCIKHVGSERPRMILGAIPAEVSGDPVQCGQAYAGPLTLMSEDQEVICSPRRVVLEEKPSQEVTVNCGISIAGIWTNLALSGGQFTPTTPDSDMWTFEGLDTGPYGRISGRVSGKPPRLYFEGHTAQGRPVSGYFTFERKKVSFSLTVLMSSTPFTGVLQR
jgi:hypothetical protein